MLTRMGIEEIEQHLIEEALKPWPTRQEQLVALYTRDLCLVVLRSQEEPDVVGAVNALKDAMVRALGLMMVPLRDEVRIDHMQDMVRGGVEASFEMAYGEEWRGKMAKVLVEKLARQMKEASGGLQTD